MRLSDPARCSSRTLSGLCRTCSCSCAAIPPKKVCCPTRPTTIAASPSVTTLPRYTSRPSLRSQRRGSAMDPGRLVSSRLSPLSADWSTRTSPDSITPSAGTLSPASSSTISPGTSSPMGRVCTFPFRRTRQLVRAASSCNFKKAASLPYSDTVETKVARNTAAAMPTGSYQSAPRSSKSRLAPSASIRILMMGSPKAARKCRQKLWPGLRGSSFEPYLRRISSICRSFSPLMGSIGYCTACHSFVRQAYARLPGVRIKKPAPRPAAGSLSGCISKAVR